MLSKKIQAALTDQINTEFYAAYLYLAMAAHFEEQNYEGFAQWFRMQAKEEEGHAMKLFDFMIARGGHVDLKAPAAPTQTFGTVVDVFTKVLAQEQGVTAPIDALYELAFKEKAYAATVELQWFLMEQVEEEKSAREILADHGLEQRRFAGPGLADHIHVRQPIGFPYAEQPVRMRRSASTMLLRAAAGF